MPEDERNTLLDFDLDDDMDFEPAPADKETQLRIERATLRDSSAGTNLQVVVSLIDFPNADDVFYTVWLPQPSDEAKDAKRKRIALRNFYKAFGVEYSNGVDYKTDLPGCTAWGIVGQEEYQGVVKNTVKKLTVPK